jgi:hypothetical protein
MGCRAPFSPFGSGLDTDPLALPHEGPTRRGNDDARPAVQAGVRGLAVPEDARRCAVPEPARLSAAASPSVP